LLVGQEECQADNHVATRRAFNLQLPVSAGDGYHAPLTAILFTMPSIPLYPPRHVSDGSVGFTSPIQPLPHLLQTPSGLALLEIQGTLHTSSPSLNTEECDLTPTEMPVGQLVFPFYDPSSPNPEDQSWMKRVYLYVGKHQRLTGEVKKLPKAIAVVRKRDDRVEDRMELDSKRVPSEEAESSGEQLEIVEIVKYKILFASRPEPVGD
jgi:chromosome transmission fidelity protein 8